MNTKLLKITLIYIIITSLCLINAWAVVEDSAFNNDLDKHVYKAQKPQYVPGEIIVKFKEHISEIALDMAEGRRNFRDESRTAGLETLKIKYKVKKMERVIEGLGDIKNRREFLDHVKGIRAKHVRRKMRKFSEDEIPDLHNIYLLKVDKDADIEAICAEYKKDPNVEYAEPNHLAYTAETFPNDPDFTQQWALHNTGQTAGTEDADIDAPEAWDVETGNPNVVIAMVDTGVDWNHPDLANNIWINPGEDINHNGVVDEEDFNELDDDDNGYIDDIRGWDFVTMVDTGG